MQYLLLYTLIIILTVYLVKTIFRNNGIGKSTINKRLSEIKEAKDRVENEIKKRNQTSKFYKNSYSWFMSLRIFNVSEKKMEELNYLALRLHKTVNSVTLTGQDLLTRKCYCMLAYIFIILGIGLFNFKVLPLVLVFPLFGTIVETMWRNAIKEKDEMIESDFFDFFSEFFFTYKFPDNIREHVDDVALRFYDRANEETKHMIDLLRADAKISEEYALNNLKKNFRIAKITRMCDQILLIISGKPVGVDGLNAFKDELNATRKFTRQMENNERKEKAQKIIAIPTVLLLITVICWVIVMLKSRTG